MTAVIENCVSLKMRTHEQMNYRRPVRGNGHRLALFLIFARKKAKNQKEVLAAFGKGIRAWKLFERKTAAYHVEKFLKKMEKEYQKRISLSATISDQTKNPEHIRVSAVSSHEPSDSHGGSSGDDDPDGDPDPDHHWQQTVKSPPKNDHSTPNGGGRHA